MRDAEGFLIGARVVRHPKLGVIKIDGRNNLFWWQEQISIEPRLGLARLVSQITAAVETVADLNRNFRIWINKLWIHGLWSNFVAGGFLSFDSCSIASRRQISEKVGICI